MATGHKTRLPWYDLCEPVQLSQPWALWAPHEEGLHACGRAQDDQTPPLQGISASRCSLPHIISVVGLKGGRGEGDTQHWGGLCPGRTACGRRLGG